MVENDGVEQALEEQVRTLAKTVKQLLQMLIRAREDAQRKKQAASEQEERELQSRFAEQRRAAQPHMNNVHHPQWWDQASPGKIAHTYHMVSVFAGAGEDPEAIRAEQRMRDELRTRYGLDVDRTGADPDAICAEINRPGLNRVNSFAEHSLAGQENAEAQRLDTQADQRDLEADKMDTAAAQESDPQKSAFSTALAEQIEAQADQARGDGNTMYDTAERRHDTARNLESQGIDCQLVATRMRADISQARPPVEAVRGENRTRGGNRTRNPGAYQFRKMQQLTRVKNPSLGR